ncbi:hypothetical protein SLEP1_g23658 [Rubroshorea leprosula]|uniref:Uncharacterized protein n=1 Tax=Rubroshorea leprosula TaxID=152421 RepID=A0AAV5JMD4_9ROSI|nr:hypothetical protein SLEP1_g23658 [Rubroshorea leprosula]
MVDNLEEPKLARRLHDLLNDRGAGSGEVDGGNGLGVGSNGAGLEIGESFRWVDEEAREGGDAGVHEAFNSDF